jgi:hypothetical protein
MRPLCPLLLALCLVTPVHAQQVYKWVDAQGRTHYSQNKDDAANAKAKVDEMTIKLPPQEAPPPTRVRPVAPDKASQPAAKPRNTATRPGDQAPAEKPGWEYSDKRPETNESRCALARAIVEGRAERSNSQYKTDQHDRDVAQNDIKAFCR